MKDHGDRKAGHLLERGCGGIERELRIEVAGDAGRRQARDVDHDPGSLPPGCLLEQLGKMLASCDQDGRLLAANEEAQCEPPCAWLWPEPACAANLPGVDDCPDEIAGRRDEAKHARLPARRADYGHKVGGCE